MTSANEEYKIGINVHEFIEDVKADIAYNGVPVVVTVYDIYNMVPLIDYKFSYENFYTISDMLTINTLDFLDTISTYFTINQSAFEVVIFAVYDNKISFKIK